MRKVYSDEEIEKYSNNPKVLFIGRNKLVLTLDFKRELYGKWSKDPRPLTIKNELIANGFDVHAIGHGFYKNIALAFIRSGEPKFSKSPSHNDADVVVGNAFSDKDGATLPAEEGESVSDRRKELLDSGKFIPSGRGVWFAPDFEKELSDAYPQISVRQGILAAGFKLRDVGYYQIGCLEKKFRETLGVRNDTAPRPQEGMPSSGWRDNAAVRDNPFVDDATNGGVWMSERFYRWAYALRDNPIDDVLDVFLVEWKSLTFAEKSAIREHLMQTAEDASMDGTDIQGTVFDAVVLRRRETILGAMADDGFSRIAEGYQALTRIQKKRLCLWIQALPKDPAGKYTKTHILQQIGITKSSYYLYIGKEDFGLGEVRRIAAEERDAETIRKVFEYKGFKKGSRQIYMLLPRLTGESMGLKRICRLMKAHGMDAGIRGPNEARRQARKLLDETVRPNLLRRTFRLHRPNEVRVTDVTYLDFGDSLRAYGSALMDPVTSRLLAFVVSEYNDLDMALETLHEADAHPCVDGGIFHSDRGALYRTEEFQKEILERGLTQSMSKKGNCWDNATQESFFGHFKDECDITSCNNISELKERVAEYAYYYDNERGLWDRGRMTPVEYEEYLLSLSEEEFGRYLAREEAEYEAMKKRAAELAKKRYGTLGV